MNHPQNPKSKDVLNAIDHLSTSGTLAENQNMVFLNLSDDWIFNALEVLKDFGFVRPPFFLYPPVPVGAHIKIVTKEEAEKYEVFDKRDVIDHLLGKTVNFEVVTAHVSYPRIKKYGVEARYKIRVRSPELSEIRQELTGLRTGPNNGHFVILVGVRNPELNKHEEFEKKLSPDEKHGELDDKEDDMDEY